MKLYSKYLIVLIAVFSFSIIMPYFYSIIFIKNTNKDFVYYSEIIDDFAVSTFTQNRSFIYRDKAGNTYTEKEFKQILPQVYVRDLVLTNSYSEIINNRIISAEDMIKYNFYLSARAKNIDEERIRIKLSPVFETQSGSANLTMPVDLARIGKDITFINARTREIDNEKSELFTNELINKGFTFPVKLYGTNPDVRKAYDVGTFLIDKNNTLFRLYMVKGKPVVEKYNTNIDDEEIIYISIRENKYADFYGFMIAKSGNIFLININHTLSKITVDKYNPNKDTMRININPLHILLNISTDKYQYTYIYDKNYNLLKSYSLDIESSLSGYRLDIYNMLFPFSIYHDASSAAGYLKIEKSENLLLSIVFIVFLLCIYIVICRYFKSISKTTIIDIFVIALSGIYGFTALILLQNFKKDTLWE